MGPKGDNVAIYKDVETQQLKFDELMASNYLPVATGQGQSGTVLKKFDPTLEEILWVPVVGGG